MREKHTMDWSEVANGKGRSAGVRTGTSRPTTMRVGRVLVVRCVSNALKLETRYERMRGCTTSMTHGLHETHSKGMISKLRNMFLTTARLTATTTATMTKLRGKGESNTIRNVLHRRKRTMTNMRNA